MNKEQWAKIVAVAGLLAAILALFYVSDDAAASPQRAIAKVRTVPGWTIVAQWQVPSGIVAFTYRPDNDGGIYGAEFVRRTWRGWRWGFGGSHSASLPASTWSPQRQLNGGWTGQYLPDTSGTMFGRTPFPMLYGTIRDTQIAAVDVLVTATGQVKRTELLQGAEGSRIWMLLLPKSDGARFELRAVGRDGAVVSVKQIDESWASDSSTGFRGIGGTEPVR
jgi:hypothetical protein